MIVLPLGGKRPLQAAVELKSSKFRL